MEHQSENRGVGDVPDVPMVRERLCNIDRQGYTRREMKIITLSPP
jgi:hypothetical protein